MTIKAPLTGYFILDEIVGIVGWDAMVKLVRKYGGHRHFVSRHVGNNLWLIDAIGTEDAAKIVDYLHGTELYFPPGMRREIEMQEFQRRNPVLTVNEIATQFYVSYRYARDVLQRRSRALPPAERDDPQMNLLTRFE